MLVISYGTQAELIKLAPIVQECQRRKVPVRMISTGQHGSQVHRLHQHFNLPDDAVTLCPSDSGHFSQGGVASWFFRTLLTNFLKGKKRKKEIFGENPVGCVVHGDTLSTLMMSILAKRFGIKLLHIESGLRSFNYFQPFPEEIVRIIANRLANTLFPAGEWASENLRKMRVRGDIVTIPSNTCNDAIRYTVEKAARAHDDSTISESADDGFALISIHRYETVTSSTHMQNAVDVVLRIAELYPVRWPMHEVFRKAADQYGILKQLNKKNIEITPVKDYPDFMELLNRAKFIVADGGSIQEESWFLNKPCLLLRNTTERLEGLDENALLSCWDKKKIEDFLSAPESYVRLAPPPEESPSKVIVNHIQRDLEI